MGNMTSGARKEFEKQASSFLRRFKQKGGNVSKFTPTRFTPKNPRGE